MKRFVSRPCDVGIVTRCYIERNRKGGNRLNPVYSLCADLEDGTGRELIVCRKYLQANSSYYVFSLKHDDLTRPREQRSSLYLGKLRSVNDEDYVLYDSGATPIGRNEDKNSESKSSNGNNNNNGSNNGNRGGDSSLYRKELLCVRFNSKARPIHDDSRGMELCIKTVFPDVSPSLRNAGTMIPHGADAKDMATMYDPNSNVMEILPGFREILQKKAQNQLHKDKYLVFHERNSK